MSVPKITMFKGRPITDLTREELIEALEYAAEQLAYCYTPQSIRARALGQAEMMKRGESGNTTA